MTKFALSPTILLRSASTRRVRDSTRLMENISKFMGFILLGIIGPENFDRFRKLCFNHFGKVTLYLRKFGTIFEEINPSISRKIIHKNDKIT